ncbi:hypothetical protein RhiirC2_804002 [Rhizophagus irregularis]|uniref:Uncharacterized protein n=1 Tax=Rhizophagus irregularis TaxID=588596 RepID=A0A2N1L6C9_9GLOM|nr:hypothetical protein RhiirC2_804002 [Rhizophagus irregularis]
MLRIFLALYKVTEKFLNAVSPISSNNSFMNFISNSVAVFGMLNLIRNFIIHIKIHKNLLSLLVGVEVISGLHIAQPFILEFY